MKEAIKNIILQGLVPHFGYKTKRLDWVGDSYIGIIKRNPETLVVVYTEDVYEKYPLEEIDMAIDSYISKAFSEKNLWYKTDEAKEVLLKKGFNIDTDIWEDKKQFTRFNNIRKKIIKNARDTKDS